MDPEKTPPKYINFLECEQKKPSENNEEEKEKPQEKGGNGNLEKREVKKISNFGLGATDKKPKLIKVLLYIGV